MSQLIPGQMESQLAERIRSLEVRWIFPGRLESAVPAWLERFPGEVEVRDDIYLLDPHLRGLSVKVRADTAFEVKMYRGSPGVLEVAGRALGRMESWQKWSFPCDRLGRGDVGQACWIPVHKRRRVSRFSLADRQAACAVEFTAVRARERNWCLLGPRRISRNSARMSPAPMRLGCGKPSSPGSGRHCPRCKPCMSGLSIHPLLGEERAARRRHCQRRRVGTSRERQSHGRPDRHRLPGRAELAPRPALTSGARS